MIKFWQDQERLHIRALSSRVFSSRVNVYQTTVNDQYVKLLGTFIINSVKVDKTLLNQGFKI